MSAGVPVRDGDGPRCSDGWAGLPAYGTASPADFWVAVEQPGAWGRDAFAGVDLGDGTGGGKLIEDRVAGAGGRALLIRAPGRHVAWRTPQARHVYVTGGAASAPWLLEGQVALDAELAGTDWSLAASARPDALLDRCPWLSPAAGPVLLVCTNSRRDVCCAVKGRPVALDAAAPHPGRVWECSHTGGHRFAPTGIVLPLGQYLARLTADLACEVVEAASSGRLAIGSLGPVHDRGRGQLPAPLAAAESWVRALVSETDPAVLSSQLASRDGLVDVRHVDGRGWRLSVDRREGAPLPESCGKSPVPSVTWHVEERDLGAAASGGS